MKTAIIQLENFDEVVSIKDKISWYPRRRIVLVWPKHGKVLNSQLDLILILRAAQSSGQELAVVTHHPAISEWASEIDLPVFASISLAEKSDWKQLSRISNEKRSAKGLEAITVLKMKIPKSNTGNKSGRLQRTIACVTCILVLLSLFLVIVPQAQITYFPNITYQEVEFTVKASEVYSGFNPSGNIPAGEQTVEVSGELSMPSSGKTRIPTSKSSGIVLFTNLTATSITIPAGTFIQAGIEQPILFTTLSEVHLPGGIDNSIEANVDAVLPGSEGNIAAGEITTTVGDLSELIYVTNEHDFTGGGDVETASPSEADYIDLEDQLMTDLQKQGLEKMKENIANGMKLIDESLHLESVLQKEQVMKIGEPSDEAVLRLTIQVKALSYQENDLKSIADTLLKSSRPVGFQNVDKEIILQQISDITMDELGQSSWKMSAFRRLVPEWNPDEAAQLLAGKQRSEAANILSGLLEQSETAKIKMNLPGWPWMPILPTQIRFINGVSQ